MIKVCTCEHLSQDEIHGKNNRVMNLCKKGSFCRCTVCGKEYQLKADEVKSVAK